MPRLPGIRTTGSRIAQTARSMLRPFHIAILVDDLDNARAFYGDVLGCTEGRSDTGWIDFNLFGHQLVCHRGTKSTTESATGAEGKTVDEKSVPVPHFGVVLKMDEWQKLADRIQATNVEFMVAPYIRFRGQVGEQGTLFIADPAGNALEFKGFKSLSRLFAS